VCAECIRAVAAAGDGDLVPGTDQHDLVVELPLLGSRAPSALELDGDRGSARGLIRSAIACDGARRLGHALSLRAAGVDTCSRQEREHAAEGTA
jgi:hypothetical protein